MADAPTHDELSKMKVADLKKMLKAKNLSTTGTKSDLVERLEADLSTSDTPANDGTEEAEVVQQKDEQEATEEILEENDAPLVTNEKEMSKDSKKEITSPTLITSPDSEENRLKQRADRFGVVNAESKKLMRAERFGVVSEDLKKQQRAERFGITSVSSPTNGKASTTEDVEKLKERAKRFGQVLSPSLSKVDEDEKVNKRKERFGDVTAVANNKPAKFAKITFNSPEEDTKKKRAERFNLST